MAEAIYLQPGNSVDWTPTAAVTAGEVLQVSDGRAGFAPTAIAAGIKGALQVKGIATVAKVVTQTMLQGSKVWWDHSANSANLLQVNDKDFFLGIVQEDAAYAGTTAKVALNEDLPYTIGIGDGFISVPVAAAGVNHHIVGHKEGVSLVFDVTAEAQKLDAMSPLGIAPASVCLVEALVCVNLNGDNAAFDFNIGLANGTNATDADSITEYLFCHTNGSDLNIYLQSLDTVTTTAAVDTTVNFAVGTPFLVQFDLADYSDIQAYINGVNVNLASDFTLEDATGPMRLLAHMEKTADDSPGNITVMRFGLRARAE